MGKKKIAVLDLGTNTFHLLVASITASAFQIIETERVSVKIGMGGINEGYITDSAKARALDTLRYFKDRITKAGITEIFATATSAIRNAKNGRDLASEIERETGIKINIISGDEEAELIYYGVKTALNIGKDTSVVMDIGGGSVEFIICNQEKIFWKESFEIGAQRLLDIFHYHDPILPDEIKKLESYLDERLSSLKNAIVQYKPNVLIGSSGSFDTLVDIYNIRRGEHPTPEITEFELPLDVFHEIQDEIIHKNRDERQAIPGMVEMRVDMIVVACCLIHFVLESFQIEKIRISAHSLKEGVVFSIINSLQKNLD